MFDNLQDNGYEFAEEVEQHEKAEERLLWMKRGFAWCYEMTDKQREVAYYKLFTDQTDKSIAKLLNLERSSVTYRWGNAKKRGKNITF